MNWEVGDLVSGRFFGWQVVYRIVCFIDRDPCPECVDIEPSKGCPDDVHGELVWTEPGAETMGPPKKMHMGVGQLFVPQINEMVLLALAAS